MAKKSFIIKDEPDSREVALDCALQSAVQQHVATFGFCSVIINIIKAYRHEARRYNEAADKLEQKITESDRRRRKLETKG